MQGLWLVLSYVGLVDTLLYQSRNLDLPRAPHLVRIPYPPFPISYYRSLKYGYRI